MSDNVRPLGPTLAEQRATALRLHRTDGLKFHEVAREMGIGTDEAYRLVTAARDGSPAEDVAEARARDVRAIDAELARLDDIQAQLADSVRKNDLDAIDRSLKATEKRVLVLARRAKLLGLDAPTKSVVTVATAPGDDAIDQLTALLDGLQASSTPPGTAGEDPGEPGPGEGSSPQA